MKPIGAEKQTKTQEKRGRKKRKGNKKSKQIKGKICITDFTSIKLTFYMRLMSTENLKYYKDALSMPHNVSHYI
jgi:hypothetical protein